MNIRLPNSHPSVRLEGALLSRDFLQRLSSPASGLAHFSETSYGLDSKDKLGEAIARTWNSLRGRFEKWQAERDALPMGEAATGRTREAWLQPLMQELGFGRLPTARALEIDGRSYAISHHWGNVPIHLIGAGLDLNTRVPGQAGAAVLPPHSLVQEALNRSDAHLWAILSNGRKLRLLRDNVSLSRQAFIEWDLDSIFENELYADFAILWLICHPTRLESKFDENGESLPCILEQWVQKDSDEGTRALDRLRVGVENAITTLGSGFLAHPANGALRAGLQQGDLSPADFYRQVLRLAYRLLFVCVAEENVVLPQPPAEQAGPEAKAEAQAIAERYAFYSLDRLRKIAGRSGGSEHGDAWRTLRQTFTQLRDGYPALGIPALGGFLFEPTAFDAAELTNKALFEALRALCFIEESGKRRPVNFRDLGSQELGSVYESLLELHPDIQGKHFTLGGAAGNERKTSGSYYTPAGLVKSLLDSALQPVIDRALKHEKREDRESALLALKVCDPACGSGAFLTAAARRIANTLARVRSGGDEPTEGQSRAAMRDVVKRCIYGIDLNPMAVELCKVALWMESLEPGKPLSFLDSHIRAGNSLLGTTPELLEAGIPDAAFAPIEGDDKKVCAELKKRNKQERGGQGVLGLFSEGWTLDLGDLRTSFQKIELIDDDDISGVRRKEELMQKLQQTGSYLVTHQLADAWCAAFVWKKVKDTDPNFIEPITQEVFERLRKSPHGVDIKIREEIQRLGEQYIWFHPHIEFPEVFGSAIGLDADTGGFDLVLGNPPWEHTELKEKEWFATRQPEIANAATGAIRKRMIDDLAESDSSLWNAFLDARREHDAVSHFAGNSGRFPLCGRGRINTYAIFAELNRSLINGNGRVGCIVPSGIATDDTTKYFFRDLNDTRSLVSLFDYENREKLFPAVDSRMKFCLLTMAGSIEKVAATDFVFFATRPEHQGQPGRRFTLSSQDIALLNPNTRTCPIFRSSRDAELTKAIYRRVPVLIDEAEENGNPWGISFRQGMFNMTSDSELFRTRSELEERGLKLRGNVFVTPGENATAQVTEEYLPLYEGKMVTHYDHRASQVVISETAMIRQGQPEYLTDVQHQDPFFLPKSRFWVARSAVSAAIPQGYRNTWFFGFSKVTSPTNQRTFLGALVPQVAAGDSFQLILAEQSSSAVSMSCLVGCLSSFVLDYCARQKVGGVNLNFFLAKQLPVLPYSAYEVESSLYDRDSKLPNVSDRTTICQWIALRVLELTYTAVDMEPFAHDLGYDGPPFLWDVERRWQLRCELDAAYFHLYGLSRQETAYVLDTFTGVRTKEESAHGEYRSKRRILELFDEMDGKITAYDQRQAVK